MKEALEFLSNNKPFYLATVNGDVPRVRPFGFVMEFEGKLYFTLGNQKEVYKQLIANPNAEISTTAADGSWIRLYGKVVFDKNIKAKEKAFEVMPRFSDLYKSPDNPVFEVFYFTDGKIDFYGNSGITKTIKL